MKSDLIGFAARFLVLLLLVCGIDFWRFDRGVDVQSDPRDVVARIQIPRIETEANITKEETPAIGEENISSFPITQPAMEEQLALLGAKIGDPVYIRIFKLTAELELWIKTGEKYELLQTYEVCRQSGYLGPKLKEGDLQGPEGFYEVTKERLNPNSKFHLAFNIGYPNMYDRLHHRTGSALMVHGGCVSVGCFAMTDQKIEEIYELVERALNEGLSSVEVHIFPFRMSDAMMERYRVHKWFDFWSNLKEGYDYFESRRIPPKVSVAKRRYLFEE